MTPEQRALIQSSYARLVPMADTAAHLFYTRLFSIDPSLRTLFKTDFREQSRKFMDMVFVVVSELERPDKVHHTLRELGVRHAGYGVVDAHYAVLGDALLWAIEKALGKDAGPEVKEAWAEFYDFVADTMKQAAHVHPSAGTSPGAAAQRD